MALNRTKTRTSALWIWLAALIVSGSGQAQRLYTGSATVVAEDVDRMYVKAMQYLARTQNSQGFWPDEPVQDQPALNAFAVISLLAHGDDPNFGPYSQTIHRALDYILKQMDEKTGYIGSSMYNHGFSTLALAESYGAVDDPRLGPALQKAVQLIVNAQKVNGRHAWRYSPDSQDADTTVTGAQMVALLAARNAGMPVPEETIQNGLKFFLSCQTPEGGIGYTLPVAPNATRSAIACVVLALAKDKNSPAFKSIFAYFKDAPPDHQYPQYFLYYASQAYFHGSPELWNAWNRANIRELHVSQSVDGNWEGQFGPTFATTGSLLSLALNYRYLPIYER